MGIKDVISNVGNLKPSVLQVVSLNTDGKPMFLRDGNPIFFCRLLFDVIPGPKQELYPFVIFPKFGLFLFNRS